MIKLMIFDIKIFIVVINPNPNPKHIREKVKYLFSQLSLTNHFIIMSAFYVNCNCPAPEPCTGGASKGGIARPRRFSTQDQYDRHIRDRHPDLYFNPKNILLPAYKEPGTPQGFQGTSFKWVVAPLHEVNNEGVEKWVILKIPRALVDGDVEKLNISGLSLNGILIFYFTVLLLYY